MIFDSSLWVKESVAVLVSPLASLYAILLVCVYFASVFTELAACIPEQKVKIIKIYFSDIIFQLTDLNCNPIVIVIVVYYGGIGIQTHNLQL